LTELFPPRLESDESEKKKTKKILNGPIYTTYSFTSEGKIKKDLFKVVPDLFEIILIKNFGERTTEIIRVILYAESVISFFVLFCFKYLVSHDITYKQYETEIIWVVATGLTSFFLAEGITDIMRNPGDSFCHFCGKRFACEEIKNPFIKEISTADDYIVKITRFWKCKFCGRVDLREGNADVSTHKGDYQSKKDLQKIQCINCGEKNVIEEFRRSDVKVEGNKEVTRNYYKCNNCGYLDIKLSVLSQNNFAF
jgi:hypothetical protein